MVVIIVKKMIFLMMAVIFHEFLLIWLHFWRYSSFQ